MRRPSREALAHHEAGHAVAGVCVGMSVERVTIDDREAAEAGLHDMRAYGFIETSRGDVGSAMSLLALRRQLLVAAAGFCAEKLYCERAGEAFAASGGNPDYKAAWRIAASINPAPRKVESRLRRAQADAARFVQEHWNEIRTVAAELLKRGAIDGATVHMICKRAVDEPPP